jgi:hypothetical protein
MQDIPLFPTDYRRSVAKAPFIPLVNRYVEQNPSLNDSEVSVIARPGMRKFVEVGEGPVRALYSSAGAFNDSLFAVSGGELYKIDSTTGIGSLIGAISTNSVGDVSMAATSPIGTEVPSYLFIAEGGVLYVYTDNGHAFGKLELVGLTINNGFTVSVGGVYYQWTNASVNAGTPDGTVGNPWLVALGIDPAASFLNLFEAIQAVGIPGTTYSSGITVANAFVEATSFTATEFFVEAREAGTGGNSIALTSSTANLVWNGSTLSGGGADRLTQVRMPDDAGAISVSYINSFVIVVPVQEDSIGTTGKFYWVDPGERIVSPLNFANAERSPDKINQVITFGDMFWLFGDTTTEPWVTTGNADAPMQRFQGILFDRGSWPGTAVKVRDVMIVADEEGGVFQISNGQQRISNPSIEERLRKAISSDAS